MKYVVYYRVSTKKQRKSGLGLEAQQSLLSHYLNESDIAGTFTEVASAGILERPQLQKAIELCKRNGYGLAIAKIDRLSRITEDAISVWKELDGYLYSCDIPTDKGARMDKFTLTIFMAIADRERELIKIRTKAALAEKKKQGIKLGKPENLTNEGRKKAWERRKEQGNKNQNNLRVMELIAMYKDQCLSLQAIADKLNEQTQNTPSGKKHTKYHKTTVSRLHKRYLALQSA